MQSKLKVAIIDGDPSVRKQFQSLSTFYPGIVERVDTAATLDDLDKQGDIGTYSDYFIDAALKRKQTGLDVIGILKARGVQCRQMTLMSPLKTPSTQTIQAGVAQIRKPLQFLTQVRPLLERRFHFPEHQATPIAEGE